MSLRNIQDNLNIPKENYIKNNENTVTTRIPNNTTLKSDTYSPSRRINNPITEDKNVGIQNFYTPKQLLLAYTCPQYIENMIKFNPNISRMLSEKGLDTKIYPYNIGNILKSHITTTTAFAMQIANKMDIPAQDKKTLELACVFHDFGKILIPTEILEKPRTLTRQEKDIVNLHAELGYELLSTTGMNNRVLELIKNHHNPMHMKADVLGQILSVADIYSALREDRSYKNSMSEQEALTLLDQKAREGEVSTEVVNALKEALSSAKTA